MVATIPDGDSEGDYLREVVIEAKPGGLEIDNYILIPWAWIDRASRILRSSRECDIRPLGD